MISESRSDSLKEQLDTLQDVKNWGEFVLSKLYKYDPRLNDDKMSDYDPTKNYKSLPYTKGNKPSIYFSRIQSLAEAVDKEFLRDKGQSQFERDGKLWRATLKYPGMKERGDILRRIFVTLRYGGFLYRSDANPDDWNWWSDSGWPIAAALSHGGRVMIQLPKYKEGKKSIKKNRDHSFWRWLMTGSPTGDVSKVISTCTNGDDCEKEGKIVFKRLGGTHGLNYKKELDLPLPHKRQKSITETKPYGITFRNTKVLSSKEYVLEHHRHWGMNIPLGGHGRESLIGETISANGEHGHIYIYYMSGAEGRNGGLLIGVEGSEYGKWDQVGHKHKLAADSCKHSPTWGYKWRWKFKQEHLYKDKIVDLKALKGPSKYNGMFVDLSGGWEFLIEKLKEWNDDMVMETALRPIQESRLISRSRSRDIYRIKAKLAEMPSVKEIPISDSEVIYETSCERTKIAEVLSDFTATTESELTVTKGEVIEIVDDKNESAALCRFKGKVGRVPKKHLRYVTKRVLSN